MRNPFEVYRERIWLALNQLEANEKLHKKWLQELEIWREQVKLCKKAYDTTGEKRFFNCWEYYRGKVSAYESILGDIFVDEDE